ncbi:hypothetical protein [Kordia sp.]|uniref:hypothetical protein n=1 Tax=Kordia sp. TaxID=1965332 RepID=UPI003D26C137
MKKKSIVLQLKKSKIANFHMIYGGGTLSCHAPSETPPSYDRCTEDCTSSVGGVLDSISNGDTKP